MNKSLLLCLALMIPAPSLMAQVPGSPALLSPAVVSSDAIPFLLPPFAGKVVPANVRVLMNKVADYYLQQPLEGESAGAQQVWRRGLLALSEVSSDGRYAESAGKISASDKALEALAGDSAVRQKAIALYNARLRLAPLPGGKRWGAPEFKIVSSMSNRGLCQENDFITSALALDSTIWGINQPLGIMIIDYFRVPALLGWVNLLDQIDVDGRIRGDSGESHLKAGAFLLAARQMITMAETMSQTAPYTRSVEYLQDLRTQQETLARATQPTASESVVAMIRACRYQLQHLHSGGEKPNTDWFRGTFFAGIMAIYKATGDNYYLKIAQDLAKQNEYQPGPEADKIHGANDFGISQTYLQLYEMEKRPEQLAPTRQAMDQVLKVSKLGKFEWSWVDALFMAPAAWAQMSHLTGDARYLEHMNQLWWETVDKLWDPEAGLVYRDRTYIVQPGGLQLRECNGQKVFWGRGNGWFTGALCRVLENLPADHPDRSKYENILKAQLTALAKIQGADGLWRTSLLNPAGYPMGDTSCSTFFCYGMAWAMNRGLLEKATFMPVALKAWKAIVGSVDEYGRLCYVQAEADSTRAALLRKMNVEYGTGAMLLAGSEMLPLLRALEPKPSAKTIDPAAADRVLPPEALVAAPLAADAHPWAGAINGFILDQARMTIQPTGLSRRDYLSYIRGQVKAFQSCQKSDGSLTDPVVKGQIEYIAPGYAASVAVLALLDGEKDSALLESGMRAMDFCVNTLAGGRGAFKQGCSDFYIYPTMEALSMYEKVAPAERVSGWKAKLATIRPADTYMLWHRSYNNWSVKNLAGEFLRAREGMTDLKAVDETLEMQRHFFTPCGMFNEGKAFAYDGFPRYALTGIMHRGYRGSQFEFYRRACWRGAWSSLFLQSPSGEAPLGGRSAQHVWNEAQMASMFEVLATHYARAGRKAEAGAFKRGAHLALQSLMNWRRPDGSGCVVKNRFPVEAQHGYEVYSFHANYNLYACAMLAAAAMDADDSIAETPSPADVGGFVLDVPGFDIVVANAQGNYLQYNLRSNYSYDPAGLIRVHLKNAPPVLGPSNGVVNRGIVAKNIWDFEHIYHWSNGSKGIIKDPQDLKDAKVEYLAVGPAWVNENRREIRLASYPDPRQFGPESPEPELRRFGRLTVKEQSPGRVQFGVNFDVPGGTVVENLTLDTMGLRSECDLKLAGKKAGRLYFPALVSDGQTTVDQKLDGAKLTLRLPEGGVEFRVLEPASAKLEKSADVFKSRSGLVTPYVATVEVGKMVYQIQAVK